MIEGFIHARRARGILAVFAIVAGVLVLGYYIRQQGLSYRELIVGFSVLVMAVIVFGGELGIRYGFVLWVLTLALGYRTVELTPELSIHPAEILLWLLFVCICVQRQLVSTARLTFPVWLWMFIPFWVLAWWPMIVGGLPWDRMLNEFRNFFLLIPLMIVGAVVLQRERYWRYLLLAFFFTSSCIALMGIIEYWLPEVAKLFPGFVGKVRPTITEEGFLRAQFSFWGGAPATFTCVLALPIAIVLVQWWPRLFPRGAIAIAAVLQVLAIYIGGYRSIWLVLLIQVLTACVLRLRKQGLTVALLCLVFTVGGYQFIPRTTERAMSGIAALQGHPTDTSALGRQNRALEAFDRTIEAPFGSGWSSAGWVHSDFLQVAVNLGIIAGFIFLGGYVYTLLRLGRRVLIDLRAKNERGNLGLSLLLSFIAVGGVLAMEGVSVLPQLALPVWFAWVLAEVWLRQTADARESDRVIARAYPYPLSATALLSSLKTGV